MPWVQYDAAGAICGICANEQKGTYAEKFLPDGDAAITAFLNPTPQVTSVTPRQARLALLQYGLLDQVEALVSKVGGSTKITWEYALTIDRADPLIETLRGGLGLLPAAVDQLFRTASTL